MQQKFINQGYTVGILNAEEGKNMYLEVHTWHILTYITETWMWSSEDISRQMAAEKTF